MLPSCQSGVGVNVPYKEYWFDPLHPERMEFVLKFTAKWLAYFTAWSQLDLLIMFEVILEMSRAVKKKKKKNNTHNVK